MNWMSSLAPSTRLFGDLYLPGTHNSSTSAINVCSLAVPGTWFWLAKPISVPWSTCQQVGVYEQLVDGIRVFDLRTCRVGKQLYVSHGFCNKPLEQVLQHEFMRFHLEHPREVITIFYKLDWDFANSLPESERELEQAAHDSVVRACLGNKVYSGQTYVLGEIWQDGKAFVLLPECCQVRWFNSSTAADLYDRAAQALGEYQDGHLILQLVLTPTPRDILRPCGGASLHRFERNLLTNLVDEWIQEWQREFPFKFSVMLDFYQDTNLVPLMVG